MLQRFLAWSVSALLLSNQLLFALNDVQSGVIIGRNTTLGNALFSDQALVQDAKEVIHPILPRLRSNWIFRAIPVQTNAIHADNKILPESLDPKKISRGAQSYQLKFDGLKIVALDSMGHRLNLDMLAKDGEPGQAAGAIYQQEVIDSIRARLAQLQQHNDQGVRIFISRDSDLVAAQIEMVEYFDPSDTMQVVVINAAWFDEKMELMQSSDREERHVGAWLFAIALAHALDHEPWNSALTERNATWATIVRDGKKILLGGTPTVEKAALLPLLMNAIHRSPQREWKEEERRVLGLEMIRIHHLIWNGQDPVDANFTVVGQQIRTVFERRKRAGRPLKAARTGWRYGTDGFFAHAIREGDSVLDDVVEHLQSDLPVTALPRGPVLGRDPYRLPDQLMWQVIRAFRADTYAASRFLSAQGYKISAQAIYLMTAVGSQYFSQPRREKIFRMRLDRNFKSAPMPPDRILILLQKAVRHFVATIPPGYFDVPDLDQEARQRCFAIQDLVKSLHQLGLDPESIPWTLTQRILLLRALQSQEHSRTDLSEDVGSARIVDRDLDVIAERLSLCWAPFQEGLASMDDPQSWPLAILPIDQVTWEALKNANLDRVRDLPRSLFDWEHRPARLGMARLRSIDLARQDLPDLHKRALLRLQILNQLRSMAVIPREKTTIDLDSVSDDQLIALAERHSVGLILDRYLKASVRQIDPKSGLLQVERTNDLSSAKHVNPGVLESLAARLRAIFMEETHLYAEQRLSAA